MDYQARSKEELIKALEDQQRKYDSLKKLYDEKAEEASRTEQNLSKRSKELNEERLRVITESSLDAIILMDNGGFISFWNPAAEHLLGYKKEEVIGLNLHELLAPPRYLEKHLKAFPTFVNCGEGAAVGKVVELEALHKNGQEISVELSVSRIRINDSWHAVGLVRDIRQRKQAELSLRESELKYRKLVESINDVLFDVSPDGTIKYISPSIEKIVNLKPEQLIGHNFLELVYEEDRPFMTDVFRNNRFNEFKSIEYRYRKDDGKIIWVQASAQYAFEGGRIVGRTGVLHDITEQKEAEGQMRQSEERYRRLVNSVNDVIYEVDATGVLKFVSPSVMQVLGFSVEEVLNRSIFEFIYHEDVPRIVEKLKMLASRNYNFMEYRYLRKDGSIHWVRSSTSPLMENGVLVGGTGILTDITERKQAEDKLLQSESRYKTIFEENNSIMLLLDPDTGLIKDANPAACAFYGWTKDEICCMKISDINTLSFDEIKTELQKAKELKRRHFIFKHRIKSGEVRDVEVYSGPLQFDNSQYLFSIIQDITGRRKAYDQIRQLSQAVKQSPVSIVITDLSGNIEYANPQACKTSGYSLEELIGNNPRVLKSGETSSEEYAGMWQAIAAGRHWRGVFHNKRRNGELYWESSQISPIFDEKGDVVNYLAVKEDITEQKRIQEELVQSEQRFRQVVSQSLTVIWEVDKDGLFTFVSPVATQVWGHQPEELVNQKHFYDLHPEEGRVAFKKAAFEVITEKKTFKNFVNPIVTKLGDLIWVSTNGEPILDEQGNLIGYRGADNDITERKRTEEILRQNEEKYRYMFVNNPQPMWIYDIETLAFLEVNNAAISHYGYSRDEFLSMTLKDIRPEEDIEPLIENVRTTPNSFSPATEWRHRKKIGEIIQVEIISHPIFYSNREARHVLVNDITKRKLAENEIRELNANLESKIEERTKALAQNEKKYRMVVENVAEVIFQTDAQGLWVFLNRSWEDVTGFTLEESIGHNFIDFVYPDDRARNWELFEPLVKREKEYCRHEIRYLTKNGGFRWIEVFARLGLDENDQIVGTYGTLQDVTERRKAEDEIMTARMEADQANQAKSEFLSRMSHELRTPLNSILGFAQLLDMGVLNSSQRKGVNHILKSGKHLLDLINEVLDIARIESGRLSLSIESVQLSGLITEMIEIIRPQAVSRKITIEVIASSDIQLAVKSDRQRLKQILLNLLNNAIKYNREGGAVRIDAQTKPAGMVRLSIADTGFGIAKEFLDKLFTPSKGSAQRTPLPKVPAWGSR